MASNKHLALVNYTFCTSIFYLRWHFHYFFGNTCSAFRQYVFLYERCSTMLSIQNPALMEEIVIMFLIRSDGSLYITAIYLHRIVCNSLCTLVNRGMFQIPINFSKPCCVRGVLLLLYNSFATLTWISYRVKYYRNTVHPNAMKKEDKLTKDKLDRKVRHPTASFSTKSIIMNLIIAFFLYLLRRTIGLYNGYAEVLRSGLI